MCAEARLKQVRYLGTPYQNGSFILTLVQSPLGILQPIEMAAVSRVLLLGRCRNNGGGIASRALFRHSSFLPTKVSQRKLLNVRPYSSSKDSNMKEEMDEKEKKKKGLEEELKKIEEELEKME